MCTGGFAVDSRDNEPAVLFEKGEKNIVRDPAVVEIRDNL